MVISVEWLHDKVKERRAAREAEEAARAGRNGSRGENCGGSRSGSCAGGRQAARDRRGQALGARRAYERDAGRVSGLMRQEKADMILAPLLAWFAIATTALLILSVACSDNVEMPSAPQHPQPVATEPLVPTSVPTAISTPTPRPPSTPIPLGLGITRHSSMANLEEAGFDFNVRKPEQTRDGELVVGYSPYDEYSSSAVVNLIGDRNDIKQAKLFLYDAETSPLDSALYLVTFMQSVMPQWEGGSVWLKDTIGDFSGSRTIEAANHSRGNAQITVTRNWFTDVIEVDIRAASMA